MKQIYLDYNASTPLHSEVKKVIKKAIDIFGNPSSMHQTGQLAREAIEHAREQVANLIETNSEHVIFTSSGTEANNQILKSIFFQNQLQKKATHIISSTIEHSCILKTLGFLEKLGAKVSYIPVNADGRVKLDILKETLENDPECDLVSIMSANNEIGSLQPLVDIISICTDYNVPVHSDATQSLGKTRFSLKEFPLDYATFSAHKMQGPKGIGALYAKNPDTLLPLIHGGTQEFNFRAGTENIIGIIAFGKAAEIQKKEAKDNIVKMRSVSDFFIQKINDIPDTYIHTPIRHNLPNTINVSFDGIDAESLIMRLDIENIAASTGSACSTGSLSSSHVIQAITSEERLIKSAIRFSIGPDTSKEEIEETIEILNKILPEMRQK